MNGRSVLAVMTITMKHSFKLLMIPLLLIIAGAGFAETLCDKEFAETRAVRSDSFVNIGGIKQWVTIHGDDCKNPVILFLHGGPGQAESPATRSQYGYWEEDFIIVQWDQRGAAKTYGANEAPASLSLQEMINDGIELSEYLIEAFGQEKIIITGTSWGAGLGIHMLKRRPDLYHAYVGRSVPVSLQRNLDDSKQHLINITKKKNDQLMLAILNSLDGKWQTLDDVLKLRQVISKYQVPISRSDATYQIEELYNKREYFEIFQKGVEFSLPQAFDVASGGMAFEMDFYKLGFSFEVPIYIIQGEEDLMTMASTTREYFDQIKAPTKELILVPGLGHDTAFIEKNYQVMTKIILPLIEIEQGIE